MGEIGSSVFTDLTFRTFSLDQGYNARIVISEMYASYVLQCTVSVM